MRKVLFPAAALLVLLQVLPARADEATLKVGDAAPAITVGKWLKGEPVAKFDKGKIYVVEFWATWCGPCRQSIPHLSKMQEEFKDVTFIGQDCWEEDASGVPDFVTKMGDQMKYRVALDDTAHEKRGAMATAWMAAAGQNGIPTAFVVDKETKIAWIGHPMELDDVLKGIVAGNYDPKKVAEAREAVEKASKSIDEAVAKKDFDKAIAGVDELAKLKPDMADRLLGAKFQLLVMKDDYPAAWKVANQLADKFKDDPAVLNNLAWAIVDPGGQIKKPDLELAEKLATRANELAKSQNATFLDTLARVQFARGNFDKAVETETLALDKASATEKVEIAKDLEKYKAAKEKAAKPAK